MNSSEGSSRKAIIDVLKALFDEGNKALNQVLDSVLDAIDEAVNMTILNEDGTIAYANEAFCQLTKYDREELIGQNYQLISSSFHSHEFFIEIKDRLLRGESWRGEILNKAKDGGGFWTFITLVPIIADDGKSAKFICLQHEVTKKKQFEMQFRSNFMRTFQKLQNGIFKVRKEADGTLKYTMVEGRLMEEIGASAELLLEKSTFDVFEPDVAKIKQQSYMEAFKGKHVQYELELNGILIYVNVEPIIQNGVVTEIVGTVHDFSEFRNVQKRLQRNEERYQSLIKYSHEYIITLDKKGTILQMTSKARKFFSVQEAQFGKLNVMELLSEQEQEGISQYFEKALDGEVQFFEFEINHQQRRRILNISFVPIIVDDEIEGIYSITKDITAEKLIQERNAYLAHHDELTDLPNRRWMAREIEQALQIKDEKMPNLALLSLDLDRFKSINDTLGHSVGDGLLQQIASRLQHNKYKDKIDVARMGGDEFMILYANFESQQEVIDIAKHILASMEKPFYVQDFELLITASVGIVINAEREVTVTELMKRADVALYKSKELGRNMYNIYESSMNRENYHSFIMERDLRKAVKNDEFVAYFQPRVDALTGKIVGAEALIRWQHPEFGLVSPNEFIPLAEETGIIIPIGKWMKRKVCEQLVEWRNAGIPLIPISINISSNRFLQVDFAEEIRMLLTTFNLEGEWLEIEITENSIMRNEGIVQKTLQELKQMGVKIFIDDFGTGYSSFNYLKTFKLDGVKIDRSFITNIAQQPENASITSAMIKMAQALKLEVIAEGVETKEELDYLLAENCRYIQGFYFGKPCPIKEFEKRYIEQNGGESK